MGYIEIENTNISIFEILKTTVRCQFIFLSSSQPITSSGFYFYVLAQVVAAHCLEGHGLVPSLTLHFYQCNLI